MSSVNIKLTSHRKDTPRQRYTYSSHSLRELLGGAECAIMSTLYYKPFSGLPDLPRLRLHSQQPSFVCPPSSDYMANDPLTPVVKQPSPASPTAYFTLLLQLRRYRAKPSHTGPSSHTPGLIRPGLFSYYTSSNFRVCFTYWEMGGCSLAPGEACGRRVGYVID